MRKVQKDLVAMKVVELKEELGERGEALSGNKAWLRRRLHAAIVSEYLCTSSGESYLAACRFRTSANDWTVPPTEPNGAL